MRIGQASVVHQLKGREDAGVSLFDLVEEKDGVGFSSNRFGKLTALFIPDVTGRGAEKAGHGVLLHVLGHVDANDVAFTVEQGFGEGFGQLGFSNSRRPEEKERSDRTVRILDPGRARMMASATASTASS